MIKGHIVSDLHQSVDIRSGISKDSMSGKTGTGVLQTIIRPSLNLFPGVDSNPWHSLKLKFLVNPHLLLAMLNALSGMSIK